MDIQYLTLPNDIKNTLMAELGAISENNLADSYSNPPLLNHVVSNKLRKVWPEGYRALQAFALGEGAPVLVVHDTPVDAGLPQTSRGGDRPQGKGQVSELMLRGVTGTLDCVTNPSSDGDEGLLIHQVTPDEDEAANAKSFRSHAAALDFHTDGSTRILPPDYVLLLGLRGNAEAKTAFVSLPELLKMLPEEHKAVLRRHEFRATKGSGDLYIVGDFPLLIDNDRRIRLNHIEGITSEAKTALAAVVRALEAFPNPTSISINHGDLVIFRNHEVLHGRSSFAKDRPADRWLQRTQIRKDPLRSYGSEIVELTTRLISNAAFAQNIHEALKESLQQDAHGQARK